MEEYVINTKYNDKMKLKETQTKIFDRNPDTDNDQRQPDNGT